MSGNAVLTIVVSRNARKPPAQADAIAVVRRLMRRSRRGQGCCRRRRAGAEHEQQREVAAGEVREHLQRGAIGPLRVLDQQRERALGRDRLDVLGDGAGRLGHGRVEVAESDVAEQVAQGEVRHVALVLAARGAAQRPALSGRGEQQGAGEGTRRRYGRGTPVRNSRDPESLEVRGELCTRPDAEFRVRAWRGAPRPCGRSRTGSARSPCCCARRRPGSRPGARCGQLAGLARLAPADAGELGLGLPRPARASRALRRCAPHLRARRGRRAIGARGAGRGRGRDARGRRRSAGRAPRRRPPPASCSPSQRASVAWAHGWSSPARAFSRAVTAFASSARRARPAPRPGRRATGNAPGSSIPSRSRVLPHRAQVCGRRSGSPASRAAWPSARVASSVGQA